MKIVILCLQTTERGWNILSEDKKYPLKRDSKSTKQRSKIYCKSMQKHKKWFAFSTYWEHNSGILRWNLIIPASLQDRAISWYHCYLQHPSHSSLKETTQSVKYWKGMHIPSSNVKSCRSCQKQETQPKYDNVLSKLFIMTPRRVLCVHLMW